MKKPYIICHMMTSVDGRIDCAMTEHLPGDFAVIFAGVAQGVCISFRGVVSRPFGATMCGALGKAAWGRC